MITSPENIQEDTAENILRFEAQWRKRGSWETKVLRAGRSLVGTSEIADIQICEAGQDICAIIETTDAGANLKCIGPTPILYVHGRKLHVGEQLLIGDQIEFIVGRTNVRIVARSPSATQTSSTSEVEEEGVQIFEGVPETRRQVLAMSNGDGNALNAIRQLLSRQLLGSLNLAKVELKDIDSVEVRSAARLRLRKLLAELNIPNDSITSPVTLEQQVFDEVLGLGALEPLLADVAVTEIMVNSRSQIFLERKGRITSSPVVFSSDQALMNVIERIVSRVGRRIDASSPIVDARLPDGSRVNAVIPPLALRGPCLTIRRFSKKPLSVAQLIEWGSLTSPMSAFLQYMVEQKKNIMISGGTGSGKTTLLNVLSKFIPEEERVITVEDAAELQLQQEHVISLETRPANLEGIGAVTIRDLVKNCLRMRPDRIIVGECRGGEALDMLQAMNTGHDGSMSTAHANSPGDMLRRLETMVLMAGMDLPLRAVREQIASALTLIVQQSRRANGKRFVTEIAWVRGMNPQTGEYDITSIFHRRADESVVLSQETLESLWSTFELQKPSGEVLANTFVTVEG